MNIMSILTSGFRRLRNNSGVAALEFAFIAPVLILLVLAIIEFGMYFMKSYIVLRSVTSAADAIRATPNNEAATQAAALNSGLSFVSYNAPNYICAIVYNNPSFGGSCTSGAIWETQTYADGTPGDFATNGGYIRVHAFVRYDELSPMIDFLPDIDRTYVLQVPPPSLAPPLCTDPGKFLKTRPDGGFTCESVAAGETATFAQIIDTSVGDCGCDFYGRPAPDFDPIKNPGYAHCTQPYDDSDTVVYTGADAVYNQPAATDDNTSTRRVAFLSTAKFWSVCSSRLCKSRGYTTGVINELDPGIISGGDVVASANVSLMCF